MHHMLEYTIVIQPPPSASPTQSQRHPRPLGGDTARKTRSSATLDLSNRVLNNNEDATFLSIKRKPSWIRAQVPGGEGYEKMRRI